MSIYSILKRILRRSLTIIFKVKIILNMNGIVNECCNASQTKLRFRLYWIYGERQETCISIAGVMGGCKGIVHMTFSRLFIF